MQNFRNRIITASAGTGKTYRLSVEYLSLVLRYFEMPDFTPDNILVLTFTRKATAEIRARIMESLADLLKKNFDDIIDRKKAERKIADRIELIHAVRADKTRDEFESREYNILLSLHRMIANDKKLLQVMTIDSYIGSIFRNIVRPLRSIDSFEIDTEAAQKRLPDIMNELMQPELKSRIDRLLRRKIKPSLDEYEQFFVSLIGKRWTYYLIKNRLLINLEQGLQLDLARFDENSLEDWRLQMNQDFARIMDLIEQVQTRNGDALPAYFAKAFRVLLGSRIEDRAGFEAAFERLSSNPRRLYKMTAILKSSGEKDTNLYNGNKFRKKIDVEFKEQIQEIQAHLKSLIADYLIISLIGPEQSEIMEIWGEVLKIYDKFIYRYRNMSYDDIAWFTFEALYSEEPPIFAAQDAALANEFYQFLTHRSRFILIDEFQDTSLIQFNILKPIIDEVCAGEGSKSFGGLVVVGDEKQSIFGWRGGERDLLTNLPEIIKPLGEVEVETLDYSWRSSPFLMKFINYLFHHQDIQSHVASKNMSWTYDKDITSMKDKDEAKSCLEFVAHPYQNRGGGEHDIDDIYSDFVENVVKPILDQHPDETMAILCRKTKDLTELQLILDKYEIGSVFEPSADLLTHHLVAPLVSWLRFLAYGDVYRLLELLRSDYILIHSPELGAAVDALSLYVSKEGYLPLDAELKDIPLLQNLLELASDLQSKSIHESCMAIVNRFLTPELSGRRDLTNLHAFLVVVQEYELSQSINGLGIPDFLDYLQQNLKQDFMKQRSIDEKGTLQLLTIHKSKGLQFDRVFVFYNLSSRSGRDFGDLTTFMQYEGKDFQHLSDFAISLHYATLLRESKYAALAETAKQREALEEMNSLYVAFTRAESKLHVYFAYQASKGWDEFLANRQKNGTTSLPDLLCDISQRYMSENEAEPIANGWLLLPPNPIGIESKDQKDPITELIPDLCTVLADPGHSRNFLKVEHPPSKDWHRLWLIEQPNLIGDLVHNYLSFIMRNTAEEQSRGLLSCIKNYGSILPRQKIETTLETVNKQLTNIPELFDPRYDLIFNEKTIWHRQRELRIDRMMICTDTREILLVDYKTGEIHDQRQLEVYKSALQDLPWVQKLDYSIGCRFIELGL